MQWKASKLSTEIREMRLESYVLDLEVDGLTVVPPEVHGVSEAEVDLMVESPGL